MEFSPFVTGTRVHTELASYSLAIARSIGPTIPIFWHRCTIQVRERQVEDESLALAI